MPFFMIGTQRSGSNLLRLMIDQLSEVNASHPPHILQRMMPIADHHPLSESDFKVLIEGVCRLVETNPVPWSGVSLSREQVRARCYERSLMAVYAAVHDIAAESNGAKTWLCKSLGNVAYLPEIERFFGESAKYIYLYRDGRDVMLSFKKAVVGEKTAYHIAKEWSKAQRLAIDHRERTGSRTISISYEELTSQPEKVLRELCQFMGVAYSDKMLSFHKSSESEKTAKQSALWENVTKPVQANSQKFLKEASEEDISVFESVAGSELDALGYPRVYVKKGEEKMFSEIEIARFEAENKRLKSEMIAKTDEEDLKKRGIQDAVLAEVKQKFAGSRT